MVSRSGKNKQANKGKETEIASFGLLPSGQLHFMNHSKKCRKRQEQASKHREDLALFFLFAGQARVHFYKDKGNTGEYSMTVFLPAYTCCARGYVFLNRITVICTCKTAPSTSVVSKIAGARVSTESSLKENIAHITMNKARGTSRIQGIWLVPQNSCAFRIVKASHPDLRYSSGTGATAAQCFVFAIAFFSRDKRAASRKTSQKLKQHRQLLLCPWK